jgi:predicted metal-dependent hydrolase
MGIRIELGDISAEVIRKDIKHLHLNVLPPMGKVRISAPRQMKIDTIRVFAISRLAWIKTEQHKMQAQPRETPRLFLTRESHYVWGKRYLLKRLEHEAAPSLELGHNQLVLRVRPGTDEVRCQEILDGWYREQIRQLAPALVLKWSPVLGVEVARLFVQRMKTQWGSCNPVARNIRLNTELAKKPPECLEYIVVHEMVHLLEPTHNQRFTDLMDLHLPPWRHWRKALNELPVRHEDWAY